MPFRNSAAYALRRLTLTGLSAPATSELKFDLLTRVSDLNRYTEEIEMLRVRSAEPEKLSSMQGWLAATQPQLGWAHRGLLLRSAGRLDAVLFLIERTPLGLPTGYFRGSCALGETLILCEAGREELLLTRATELLLESRRAFLVMLDEPAADPAAAVDRFSPQLRRRAAIDDLYFQHPLSNSFDATISSFGYRTRRNLRYALRRVTKNSWQFHAELSAEQLRSAADQLAGTSTHPYPASATAMRLRLAADTPECFAMGLTDADGRWLSYLVGRRRNGTAEIFWQSNAAGHSKDSLCTTMRALFMREEIARGSERVLYVGGTCPLMQHCCTPTPSLQLSIARSGLRLLLLNMVLRWLPTKNHPRRRHFAANETASSK
jgi:hypothetical protein